MTAKEFLTSLPDRVSTDALTGKDTIFHFNLSGDDATQMTVAIADGKMEVKEGLHGDAECTVSGKEKNFVKLVTGELNPMMAFMMGKIKASNQSAMIKYAKLFGVM